MITSINNTELTGYNLHFIPTINISDIDDLCEDEN